MKIRMCFLLMIVFCWTCFAAAQNISKDERQRQEIFRLILSNELLDVYDDIIMPIEKEKWERKYWKITDPTPNSEINEFYEEYARRVDYAKKYFSNIVSPLYIDDRGKYYIKYGEPDDRVISQGIGKPYDDNETWVYYNYDLFIDFVEKFGFGFREVNSLLEAVTSGPSNTKIYSASSLYLERETLHQKYSRFRNITNGSAGMMGESSFYRISDDLSSEKRIILESIPPARYSFSYNKEVLNANISSSTFRAELGFSTIEFYYSFPLRELSFQQGKQIPFETLVEKQLTIFNDKFVKVLQENETLKLIANNQEQINRRIYLNQHNVELIPGIYNIALKLDNVSGKRLAILRSQLYVKDFSADTLSISDIQLSSQVKEGVSGVRNLKPNNIQVYPYVGNSINKSRPIYIYFELYNLKLNENNRTRFKVHYQVQSLSTLQNSALSSAIKFISHFVGKKPKQSIGSAFETQGDDEFQQIYLLIDFSGFPTGPTKLSVRATDLESNSEAVMEKRFLLK